jgi:hypothetical protein
VLLLATASLDANDIVIYGTAQVASGGRDSNYQIISDSTGLLTG